MKARRLDFLFSPKTVAVVGAENPPPAIAEGLLANLLDSYAGPVATVGLNSFAAGRVVAVASPAELPAAPDLAVVIARPAAVLDVLTALGERGAKGAVVLDTGLDTGAGNLTPASVGEVASRYRMRVLGPGSLGAIAPGAGLNASLAPALPPPGRLAFLTQSNAVMALVLARSAAQGIGFSLAASLGDALDIGFADVLDHLALDQDSRAVLLNIEDISEPRRFLSAARSVARLKPVVVLKAAWRALSGQDGGDAGVHIDRELVFDAVMRRAGLLRVSTVGQLLAAGRTLEGRIEVDGNRVAVIGNGRGLVELGEDAVRRYGAAPAALVPSTWNGLGEVLHPDSEPGLLRLPDRASAEAYAAVIAALQQEGSFDAILIVHAPALAIDSIEIAQVIARTATKGRIPVFLVLPQALAAAAAASVRGSARIALHSEIHHAVVALQDLLRHRRRQALLTRTPAAVTECNDRDLDAAKRLIAPALKSKAAALTEPQALGLLRTFGIPAVDAQLVGSAEAAMEAAVRMVLPVDVSLDNGEGSGVCGVAQARDVRAAAERLHAAFTAAHPGSAPPRLLLKKSRAAAVPSASLRLLLACDRTLGPVVAVTGPGEAHDPSATAAVALPPLTANLARLAISNSTVPALLAPLAGGRAAAEEALALCLARLAQIAVDLSEVREIIVDPLRVDAAGVVAAGAQVRVAPTQGRPDRRLAFPPYPAFLARRRALRSGNDVLIRPIRQEDETLVRAFFALLSPEDLRLRFFTHVKEIDHRVVVRMTQIDYDREMSLIALDPATEALLGLVGISADPLRTGAEFAVSVRSDLKGSGLGRVLMLEIIDYAMQNGIEHVWGEVLVENQPMLGLLRRLGFDVRRDPEDPGVMKVVRALVG